MKYRTNYSKFATFQVWFVGLLLLFTVRSGFGVGFSPDSSLVQAAEAEGKVVWYSSAPPYANDRLKYEFEDRFTGIEVDIRRMGSTKVEQTYDMEIETDSPVVDVIHLSMPLAFMRWRSEGNLMYYDSAAYDAYPSGFKDHGWWAAARNITVCIAYNSEIISSDEAPQTWLDLLDEEKNEKWRGKLFMGNPTIYGTRIMQYYALRKLYGPEFWEKIAAQTARVEQPYEMREFFKNPELPVSVTYLGYYFDDNAIKKGHPVRAVWPTDGVPMVQSPVAIAKDAPHPNAAKLFFNFLLSQEGQALFQVLAGDYSVREDVPPMPGKQTFKELNVIEVDWQDFKQNRENYIIEFQKFFKKQLDQLLLESTQK